MLKLSYTHVSRRQRVKLSRGEIEPMVWNLWTRHEPAEQLPLLPIIAAPMQAVAQLGSKLATNTAACVAMKSSSD
jgi:hypothetical protein